MTITSTADQPRVNLMGLTLAQMEQFFLDIGEKKFRARQVLAIIADQTPEITDGKRKQCKHAGDVHAQYYDVLTFEIAGIVCSLSQKIKRVH